MERDQAGSFTAQGGTGPITDVCSLTTHLEMYKVDRTFRFTTPDYYDPSREDSSAPFTLSPISEIGSGNPIVSRVLLQSKYFLEGIPQSKETDGSAALTLLHRCKEHLLICEAAYIKVASEIESVIADIEANPIPVGRSINPFPHVTGLEKECDNFLLNVNRTIRQTCELANVFFNLDRMHSNFDALVKALDPIIKESPYLKFLKQHSEHVKMLIEMRNFLEHPKDIRTVITNFSYIPGKGIAPPVWHLSTEKPVRIKESMFSTLNFMIALVEESLIHLVIHNALPSLRIEVVPIAWEDSDKAKPFKYDYRIFFLTQPDKS